MPASSRRSARSTCGSQSPRTRTKSGYATVTRTSKPTTTVTSNEPPTPTPTPVHGAVTAISDTTPVTDQLLTALPGTWSPDGVTLKYQWYRRSPSGQMRSISGATAQTLTVKASDVKYRLRVKVTGTLTGVKSVSKYSAWTSKAAKAKFTAAPTPVVPGGLRVGVPLTVTPGSWEPAAKLKYQWYRVSGSGKKTAIRKATKPTYTPKAADKGRRLRVRVRVKAYRAGYVTNTRYSASTSKVQPGMTGATPRISDTTPAVGQVLTVEEGTWNPTGVRFAYQWSAKSPSGKLSKITAATSRSYQVEDRHTAYKLKVSVTGTATDYAPLTKTSTYTISIANTR